MDELVRHANAKAYESGQRMLSPMVPNDRLVEALSRHGFRLFPDFRYVLVFAYPLP